MIDNESEIPDAPGEYGSSFDNDSKLYDGGTNSIIGGALNDLVNGIYDNEMSDSNSEISGSSEYSEEYNNDNSDIDEIEIEYNFDGGLSGIIIDSDSEVSGIITDSDSEVGKDIFSGSWQIQKLNLTEYNDVI